MANDILLDENGDIKIENGDFVIGVSENQEIEDLLLLKKGELKQFPLTGADIERLIKARNGKTKMLKEISKELIADGFDESNISIDPQSLEVNAIRTL